MDENDDLENRLIRVVIRYGDAEPLFTGRIAAADRLPHDATLVRAFEEPERREFNFVFRHETFNPVAEGEEIPKFHPEYRKLDTSGTTITHQ